MVDFIAGAIPAFPTCFWARLSLELFTFHSCHQEKNGCIQWMSSELFNQFLVPFFTFLPKQFSTRFMPQIYHTSVALCLPVEFQHIWHDKHGFWDVFASFYALIFTVFFRIVFLLFSNKMSLFGKARDKKRNAWRVGRKKSPKSCETKDKKRR